MRYCTDNDIELVRIYEDKGISGAKVDEDGLLSSAKVAVRGPVVLRVRCRAT